MGTKSTTNQTNEGEMGDLPTKTNYIQKKCHEIRQSKVYKLDAVGDNVLKIMPHGNQYILMMYTSNGGHASVVVDKSRLLWLADFIYKTIGEK